MHFENPHCIENVCVQKTQAPHLPPFWVKESNLLSSPKEANRRMGVGHSYYLVLHRRTEKLREEDLCS